MIHSLEDLKSGKLIGSTKLKLACDLTEFPKEILSLADTLEILDLSDNKISELPENIFQLKKLRIIFFARNNFKVFPKVLSQCSSLSMIGFKSNQIHTVAENSIPSTLRWLILTDNKVKEIPKSIGDCLLLQKCLLAGNLIEELPLEMNYCTNLELIRISSNRLKVIPKWLFELPKLSWAAFGNNPATFKNSLNNKLESYNWNDFEIDTLLGEGASGLISKAKWNSKKKDIAIKIFKGQMTSDGLPEGEMKVSIAAGNHDNLIPVLGKIKNHPEDLNGLIMKLISPDYINLGNPPSLDTCTRDVFNEECSFNWNELLKIAKGIASVSVQLHEKGINHGDLYAHNILINKNADCLLGDFGAASFYDVNSTIASNIERVEIRAFGCLLEDVLDLVIKEENDKSLHEKWLYLIEKCMNSNVEKRLSFKEILELFNDF